MNNVYVGQRCNCCGKEFTAEDEFIICPACFAPHHVSCWLEKQGCSTEGCSEQSAEEKARLEQKKRAAKLAAAEAAKAAAVHAADPAPAAPVSVPAAPAAEPAPAVKSKLPIILVAAVAVIVLIILLTRGSVNFNTLYDKYCSSVWATLGSDGSYLLIDTNPFDRDDDGLAYPAAYEAIKKVNNALGLPDSLISEMEKTTALDGRQSQSFDKKGITVAWKYHPDKGLEVTYKKNK